MIESRGFRSSRTTSCSNGRTSADGFLRRIDAATSAATSMHCTDVVAPWYSLDYVYKMEAGEAVLPRAPIK